MYPFCLCVFSVVIFFFFYGISQGSFSHWLQKPKCELAWTTLNALLKRCLTSLQMWRASWAIEQEEVQVGKAWVWSALCLAPSLSFSLNCRISAFFPPVVDTCPCWSHGSPGLTLYGTQGTEWPCSPGKSRKAPLAQHGPNIQNQITIGEYFLKRKLLRLSIIRPSNLPF